MQQTNDFIVQVTDSMGTSQLLKFKACMIFSGGEVHIKIDNTSASCIGKVSIKVLAKIASSDGVMMLLLLDDALNKYFINNGISSKELCIPYLPYARQDRYCDNGEAFGLKIMCNLINSLGYDRVWVTDPHSNVSTALLNNVIEVPQAEVFSRSSIARKINPAITGAYAFVAPDAGALKKTQAIAQMYGCDVIKADKKRDPTNGQILGITVDRDNFPLNLVVVDDICDGGRTFIELAKALPESCNKFLFVTHGIFSKGLTELNKYYDKIICSNSFLSPVVTNNIIETVDCRPSSFFFRE